jgi:hypothetical protein
MRSHARAQGVEYGRVAMLRSDAFYVTPIDVWESPSTGRRDFNNSVAVIPGFSRYPVSDRLIYGPSGAVQIWAAERFERMEEHVQWTLHNHPGWGLHSEHFLQRAVLGPIREAGFRVEEHPTMCFYRARPDESVWTSDCRLAALPSVVARLGPVPADDRRRVEAVLRRTCCGSLARRAKFTWLPCPRVPNSNVTVPADTGDAKSSV